MSYPSLKGLGALKALSSLGLSLPGYPCASEVLLRYSSYVPVSSYLFIPVSSSFSLSEVLLCYSPSLSLVLSPFLYLRILVSSSFFLSEVLLRYSSYWHLFSWPCLKLPFVTATYSLAFYPYF